MTRSRLAGLLFVALVSFAGLAKAQAPAGYVKLTATPIAATTYTDTTVVSGNVYSYLVTAVDQAPGESIPSVSVVLITPASTATHSNVLTWTAPSTNAADPFPATGYNVYRLAVIPPNPPGGLTGAAN